MQMVCIVEDDAVLRQELAHLLELNGYESRICLDFPRAAAWIMQQEPDLAIIDLKLPANDGHAICRDLRKQGTVPIMVLTSSDSEFDEVMSMNLGADDYLTKPYSLSVLYAKTTALIRRSRGALHTEGRLQSGGVVLDPDAQRVWLDSVEVTLTPKEFSLLRCLMLHRGLVLSREQLLVKCWGYDYEGEARAVDTHIRRLRDKLGDHAHHIRTVIKSGYRWEEGEI